MAGYEPQEAYRTAVRTASVEPLAKVSLNSIYQKNQMENAEELADAIAGSELDVHVWGSPKPPLQMQGQFDQLVKNNFVLNGGDIKKARSAAFRELTSRWSTTDISPSGNPIVMQDAPERVLGLQSDIIKEDLVEFVKPYAALTEGIDADKVFLYPTADLNTQANPAKNGWALAYEDKYGGIQLLKDEQGSPVRYAPTRREVIIRHGERAGTKLADRVDTTRGGPKIMARQAELEAARKRAVTDTQTR